MKGKKKRKRMEKKKKEKNVNKRIIRTRKTFPVFLNNEKNNILFFSLFCALYF